MKKLKSALHDYYSDTLPRAQCEKIEQTVYLARTQMKKVEYADNNSVSFFTFFLSQFTFIRKQVWVTQFLIVLLFATILIGKPETTTVVGNLSTLIPLLFLTWTKELSRAFLYETVEVELSTRYTLRQVVMSRIVLIGLMDLLLVTMTSTIGAWRLSVELPHIFMYLAVPFLFTAAGCLFILNHFSHKGNEIFCAGWSSAIMLISFYLSHWETSVYEKILIGAWYIAFIVALALVIIECYVLLKKCTKDHYIYQVV